MGLFSAEPTDEVAKKVLDEFNDVKDLKEVVDGILALQNSEIYEKLVHGIVVDRNLSSDEVGEPSKLMELASENMSKFPLNIPLAPLLTVKDVMTVYTFVSDPYIIRMGRNLCKEDLNKIFYGPMAIRILLLLEDFDSSFETPQPTKEFFKRLGKVKWQDKKAKKLFNDIREIFFMLVFNKWKGADGKAITFRATEKAFILLLSGCSAVINGRSRINVDDVIRANKTYLKLINTDISGLV
ncbi:MAG: hypothetical protein H5T96_09155 [Tissierellales bacterium]|nr:hypothetical protein [Tissierellales bacterium]